MKEKVLELLGLNGFEQNMDMVEDMKQPVGRLRRHARQLVAAALVGAMTLPGFATNVAMAVSTSDLLFPPMVERSADGSSAEDPRIEIESNFVQDIYGELTGILELGIRVQSPEVPVYNAAGEPTGETALRAVRSVSTNLVYDAKLLHPVSWSWVKGVDYDGAVYDVNTDTELYYDAKLEAMKADSVETAAAQTGVAADPTGMGYDVTANVAEGKQALLHFSAAAFSEQTFEKMTTVAVIRFAIDDELAPHLSHSDAAVLYDGALVADIDDLATKMGAAYPLVDFAQQSDIENAESNTNWALYYTDEHTRLNYIPDYDISSDTETVTRPINGVDYTLERPTTPQTPSKPAGNNWSSDALILAKGEADGKTVYSYLTNIINGANVKRTAVSKTSFASSGDDGTGTTIIYVDWDNKLIGTQVVPPNRDVRGMVSEYVAENFIHPDINEVGELSGGVASLKRTDSYRGRYPHTAPGDAGGTVTDGADYPLTYKLDYTFFKRHMTHAGEEPKAADFATDAEYQEAHATWAKTWEQVKDAGGNADLTDVEKYPFAYGWAECTVDNYEDVWTTMASQASAAANRGELTDYKVDTVTGVATVTYDGEDETVDFRFADLKEGVSGDSMILKAVYEPGDELETMTTNYLAKGPVYYGQYGEVGTELAGTSYVIRYQYERVTKADEFGRGVPRTREPSVRVAFFPVVTTTDPDTEQVTAQLGNQFYMKVPVDNVDVMDVEINPAAEINRIEYHLIDGYGVNYVNGLVRSEVEGDILDTLPNFDLTHYNYPKNRGSEGFVFEGAFRHLLEAGVEAVQSDGDGTNLRRLTNSVGVLEDLNLMHQDAGGNAILYENNPVLLNRLNSQLTALFQEAYNASGEEGVLSLDWHQVQYHLWHCANDGSGGAITGSGVMGKLDCINGFPGGAGIPWCKLHGDKTCTNADLGTALPITNWGELLTAVKAAVDGNGKALENLTNGLLKNTFSLASDGEGGFSENAEGLAAMKDALKSAITEANAKGGPTASQNLTWGQVQYYLIHGSFPAVGNYIANMAEADAVAEKTYWWAKNAAGTPNSAVTGTEGATTVAELLDAVARALDSTFVTPDGAPHSNGWSANLNSVIKDMDKVTNAPLKLRQSDHAKPDDGKAFADGDAFSAAIKAVVAAAQAVSPTGWNDADNLGDWDTLQYNLIHFGTTPVYQPKTTDVTTEAENNYWWKYGNEVTDWVTLMEAADATAAHGGTPASDPAGQLLSKVKPELLTQATFDTGKVGIWLRKDEMGNPITDITTFANTLKTAAADLAAAGKTMKDNMTWEILQYMIEKNVDYATAVASTSAVEQQKKDHYWWAEGNNGVKTLDELLSAAKAAYGTDGTDGEKAQLSSILYNGVPGGFAKDFKGTMYSSGEYLEGTTPAADLAERQAFYDLMDDFVPAAVAAGYSAATDINTTSFPWAYVQYYLFHTSFGTKVVMDDESKGSAPRNGYYWWSPDAAAWGTVGNPVTVTTGSPTATGGSFNPNSDAANTMMGELFFRGTINNNSKAWDDTGDDFSTGAASNMRLIKGFNGGLNASTSTVDTDLVFATASEVKSALDAVASVIVPDWKSSTDLSSYALPTGYGYNSGNKKVTFDWFVYQYILLNGALPNSTQYAEVSASSNAGYYWWLDKSNKSATTASKTDKMLDAMEASFASVDEWGYSGDWSEYPADVIKDMGFYVMDYDDTTIFEVGDIGARQDTVKDKLTQAIGMFYCAPSIHDASLGIDPANKQLNMTWYQIQWIVLQPFIDTWQYDDFDDSNGTGLQDWAGDPFVPTPAQAYADVTAMELGGQITIPAWVKALGTSGPGVDALPADRVRAEAAAALFSVGSGDDMLSREVPETTVKETYDEDGTYTRITTSYTQHGSVGQDNKHEEYYIVKPVTVNGVTMNAVTQYTTHYIWDMRSNGMVAHSTKPVMSFEATSGEQVSGTEKFVQGSSAPISEPGAEQTEQDGENTKPVNESKQPAPSAPITNVVPSTQLPDSSESATAPAVEPDAEELSPVDGVYNDTPADDVDGGDQKETEHITTAEPSGDTADVVVPEQGEDKKDTVDPAQSADGGESQSPTPPEDPGEDTDLTTNMDIDLADTNVDTSADPPDPPDILTGLNRRYGGPPGSITWVLEQDRLIDFIPRYGNGRYTI